MEAVCILKGVKADWDNSKKLLNDTNFLSGLETYDKDNIPEKTLRNLAKYIANPDFVPDKVQKVSTAAKSLCMWCRAMDVYARVAKNVEPKKKKLKEAEDSVAAMSALLATKQAELNKVLDRVKALEEKLAAAKLKSTDLQTQSDVCTARLGRATDLTSLLANEQVRWLQELKQLNQDKVDLAGNILLAAGSIAYAGPFTAEFRQEMVDEWVRTCTEYEIPADKAFTLERVVGDPPEIRQWNIQGLPADPLSIENGIIVSRGRRWPLMIDPQTQANRWIRAKEKSNRVQVIKLTESTYLRTLENCIRVGNPVLLENIEEALDPALEPVLGRQVFKKSGRLLIRLGDTDVDYSPDFRFYITTKLANPHYPPEVCVKVTVVNFTVTIKGLEDQLLVQVVAHERPELEEEKNQLVVQIASGQKQLKDLETKILNMLANSQGNILDDISLIDTLKASKVTSADVNDQVLQATATKDKIDSTCEDYRAVAKRGALLYFVIADLAIIDPMYQYSLQFFVTLFKQSMDRAPSSDSVPERVKLMINVITQDVYTQVCRGLFEKDKKLFSFLIAVQIMRLELATISPEEWAFFLTKGTFIDEAALPDNPATNLISNIVLSALVNLEQMPAFEGFLAAVAGESADDWHSWINSDNPQDQALPAPWAQRLSPFQALLVLRAIREEKLVSALTPFILNNIGKHYIDVPPFDLASSFSDSSALTPIIFVLSTGADPTLYLQNLARDMALIERLRMISLGQGQGPIAEALIVAGRESGDWVCLQNCHLASSWMPALEMLLESHQTIKLNDDFRLWLTSMPSKVFPASILQAGIKLTNEPPKGLRANLKRTYEDLSEAEIMHFDQGGAGGNDDGSGNEDKARAWKKLLFGLTFFHACIQERRKYGAIGWNIRYEWNQSDLLTAMANLRMYIQEQAHVPYETLRYVIGDVNYGGRVTDYMDQRSVAAVLGTYICAEAVEEDSYRYTEDGLYFAPPDKEIKGMRAYIDKLPLLDRPEVFGLHRNAAIAFDNSETRYSPPSPPTSPPSGPRALSPANAVPQPRYLVDTIISIQPRAGGSGGGRTPDEICADICLDFEAKIPELLSDAEAHVDTFECDDNGAMNSLGTFLQIEMLKFNTLIKKLAASLRELQRAIKGTVVMSKELDGMFQVYHDSITENMYRTHAFGIDSDKIVNISFILRHWCCSGCPTCGPRSRTSPSSPSARGSRTCSRASSL
jgi:dynein heavy chain